jgi:hypothetical protein
VTRSTWEKKAKNLKQAVATPKRCNPDADALVIAAGNMNRGDTASLWSVLRSRRPQGTPRNFIHENRETSEMPAAQFSSRTAGEGSGHTARMHVPEESDSGLLL